MTLPTVDEVLAIPEVRAGRPLVLAGQGLLDRRVRWVHVSELEDISGLLRGGELILTTGIALPDDSAKIRAYVEALASAGASALAIETGRRFASVPDAMVKSCGRAGLPLVQLRREVQFVHLTEAVHSRIVAEQFQALSASQHAHEVFTALCIEGAGAAEIVHATAQMVRAPVVFEDLMHRVMAFDAQDMAVEDLLANWTSKSRAVRIRQRTEFIEPQGWAVTSVEAHGEAFGRLVVVARENISTEQMMLIERAATALTLSRLLSRTATVLEERAHTSTLTDILERRYAHERDMHARTAALNVPTANRVLLAVAIQRRCERGHTAQAYRSRRDADTLATQIRASGISSLAATAADGIVDVLVPLESAYDKERVLTVLSDALHRRSPDRLLIGVGSPVRSLGELPRSCAEARHVLAAAGALREPRCYYEMPDVQLLGLLYTLADDPRLQAFVERMLGPLLDHDSRNETDLVTSLGIYLACRGNISGAAAAAHVSRQAFYPRLAMIKRVLGVDLESADACTSLHAALMALETTRGSESSAAVRPPG